MHLPRAGVSGCFLLGVGSGEDRRTVPSVSFTGLRGKKKGRFVSDSGVFPSVGVTPGIARLGVICSVPLTQACPGSWSTLAAGWGPTS